MINNIDYMQDISEIIKDLEDEKNKILTQQQLLTSIDFNTYKPTEKQWHRLMEIDSVRCNSKITGKLISNIFSDATDIQVGCNYVFFKLNNIKCRISTSATNEIDIIGNYKKEFKEFNDLTVEECQDIIDTVFQLRTNLYSNHFINYLEINKNKVIKKYKQDEYMEKVEECLRKKTLEYNKICEDIDNNTYTEEERE